LNLGRGESAISRAPRPPRRCNLFYPAAVTRRFLLVFALVFACGGEPAPAPAPARPVEPPAPAGPPARAEPFATPKLVPPPPPEGAALLPDRAHPLYVQRCDPDHPCPDLLQP